MNVEPNVDTVDTNEAVEPGDWPWPTDLLVCAATWMELRSWWPREDEREGLNEGEMAYNASQTFFLTGVGIPAALPQMMGLLGQVRPARILNIGIAGAYPNSGLNIGDIVVGTSEVYGDVGFELPPGASADKFAVKRGRKSPDTNGNETQAGFQPLRTSPFAGTLYAEPFPLAADTLVLSAPKKGAGYAVREGRGCTVNMCAGTERTGLLRERLFDAHFESMEGAAIAHAARLVAIPVSEIRAISNFASTRDMQPDNIRLAIANLRDYLKYIFAL